MYKNFTDKEIKVLLKSLVIISDKREQSNSHILEYFKDKRRNIKYKEQSLSSGDYSCYIESHEDIKDKEGKIILPDTKSIIGPRDMHFDKVIAIERKNSISEMAGSIKDRDRFSNEFDRANRIGTKVLLFVEDERGLSTILKHNYRSQYEPKALYASLKTFEARYNFQTKFIKKELIGMEIYYSLYYFVREILKNS